MGAGFRGLYGPRTGAEKATDGADRSGYANRPHVFLPLTWHTGCLLDVVESLVTGFRLVLRILDAEDVGGPLVRGAAAAGRVRVAIGRASDFFGAGVTEGSTLGRRVFANALAGQRAEFIGNPLLPHTYSYVPDIAAALATLGTDPRAIGGVWHLPGPPTVTTRALLDLVATDVGHPVAIRSLPQLAVRALGLVSPIMRELAEMASTCPN